MVRDAELPHHVTFPSVFANTTTSNTENFRTLPDLDIDEANERF